MNGSRISLLALAVFCLAFAAMAYMFPLPFHIWQDTSTGEERVLESITIEELGTSVFRISCPTALCDLAPLGRLFVLLRETGVDYGVEDQNAREGPGWTITIAPAPPRLGGVCDQPSLTSVV